MTEAGIVTIVVLVISAALVAWEEFTLIRPWRIKREDYTIEDLYGEWRRKND